MGLGLSYDCVTVSVPQGCTAVPGLYIPPADRSNSRRSLHRGPESGTEEDDGTSARDVGGFLPHLKGLVRPTLSPSGRPALTRFATWSIALCLLGAPAMLWGQAPPRDSARVADSTRRVVMPRPPADTDTVRKAGEIVIPGSDLPVQVN